MTERLTDSELEQIRERSTHTGETFSVALEGHGDIISLPREALLSLVTELINFRDAKECCNCKACL